MRRFGWTVALLLAFAGAACGGPYHTYVQFATVDADPAWAPDGRLIAFASSREGGGIYVVRPDGTGLRRLFGGGATDVAWSPDGRRLAYVGADGLYLVAMDGGSPRRISRTRCRFPAWSPDGERLAVVREGQDLTTAISVVNADGTGLRELLPPGRASLSASSPSWSPDGKELVLESDDGTILAVAVADGRLRTITRVRGYDPDWSPDGRWIAFQSTGALWVAKADGSGGYGKSPRTTRSSPKAAIPPGRRTRAGSSSR